MSQVISSSAPPVLEPIAISDAGVEIHSSAGYVPQLVSAWAYQTPTAVAVTCGGEALTYADLDARSTDLAWRLSSAGVTTGGLVGLYVERSLEMVVGALGILKSGAAYLPLDPAYPHERLSFMLADAGVSTLVTQSYLLEDLPMDVARIIELDNLPKGCPDFSPTLAIGSPRPEDLAYVIYTSGSSGQPKGVQVTHRNLMNLVQWSRRAFEVNSDDRATQVSSPGFDAAVWELWPYLTAGASVHIADEFTRLSAERLRDWLLAEDITISFIPTALAEMLIKLEWPADCPLRFLLTGADTLRHYPPANLPFTLINNYGPTECAVVTTSGVTPPLEHPETPPPIGRPIDNASVYILDEQLREVAAGNVGEICISGAGVARGYLNRPELTESKFVRTPYGADPSSRLYRTGDLGKYLPDGQIAFLGRIDDQVKIRGYRIEPNEISSILDEHQMVRYSYVIALEDASGERYLAAYVVPEPGSQPSEKSLRDYMASRLPPHMIPARFVKLNSLPLTPNGKVDRAALPPPNAMNELKSEAVVAPRTLTEKRLAEIAAALLGREQIGMNDNFFLLGGHSLLGTQFIARVRDAFGVELTLRTLFDSPTLMELAVTVEKIASERAPTETLLSADKTDRT